MGFRPPELMASVVGAVRTISAAAAAQDRHPELAGTPRLEGIDFSALGGAALQLVSTTPEISNLKPTSYRPRKDLVRW